MQLCSGRVCYIIFISGYTHTHTHIYVCWEVAWHVLIGYGSKTSMKHLFSKLTHHNKSTFIPILLSHTRARYKTCSSKIAQQSSNNNADNILHACI